jgi:hypothetical protein|tara:strand:+ start:16225 stop:16473 length:249 start_codon:yes stop_codon:yes gene_type:complete
MALEKKVWLKLKRKSPKVPDITCPIIDDVIARLEKLESNQKTLTEYQLNVMKRRMERLRTDNELLREGGEYWYQLCKKWLKP